MEVLNRKERVSSLILFLIMFALAVGVLMAAIFISRDLPFKENTVLRKENKEMRTMINTQREVLDKLMPIREKIELLSKVARKDIVYEASVIDEELADLRGEIEKDSIKNKELYMEMILAFRELLNIKKEMRGEEEYAEEIRKLERENRDYRDEVRDLERDLRICENDLKNAQGS